MAEKPVPPPPKPPGRAPSLPKAPVRPPPPPGPPRLAPVKPPIPKAAGAPPPAPARAPAKPGGVSKPVRLSDQELLKELDLELVEQLPARGSTLRFKVRTTAGKVRLLTRMKPEALELEQELFLAGARVMKELTPRPDILQVHAVFEEHQAFLSDLWTVGNTSDLSALRWTLGQKLAYIMTIGETLRALHEVGLIHGCLCPSNVLLNDDLRPVLTEAGTISIADHLHQHDELSAEYKTYAAPEVLKGIVLDASVDVYSLGRLAEFILLEQAPSHDNSPLPKLEELSQMAPEPVVAAIRRATAKAAQMRYRTMAAFLADLGKRTPSLTPAEAVGSNQKPVTERSLRSDPTRPQATSVRKAPLPAKGRVALRNEGSKTMLWVALAILVIIVMAAAVFFMLQSPLG